MLKVYLAGPDVFRANQWEFFQKRREICRKYGFIPLVPSDSDVIEGDDKLDTAKEIYRGNLTMLAESDIVIANISPFRGPSADVGTAFEIGNAVALGKPVYCYSSDSGYTYADRMYRDNTRPEFPIVEDFGLTDNLMVALSATNEVYETFLEAIQAVCLDLQKKKAS